MSRIATIRDELERSQGALQAQKARVFELLAEEQDSRMLATLQVERIEIDEELDAIEARLAEQPEEGE